MNLLFVGFFEINMLAPDSILLGGCSLTRAYIKYMDDWMMPSASWNRIERVVGLTNKLPK